MAIFSNSIIPAAAAAPADDVVTKSVRFEKSSTSNLNQDNPARDSARRMTLSFWVKLVETPSSETALFSFGGSAGGGASQSELEIRQKTDGRIYVKTNNNNAGVYAAVTTRVFRDFSSWYHIVIAWDTDQADEDNRLKFYVNNEQETLTGTFPSRYYDDRFGSTGSNVKNRIGSGVDASSTYVPSSSYMADIIRIDGQQLTPSSFAEEDSTTGQWKPKDTSGLTFGSAGFRLDFEDSSDIGNDVSGNANDFTASNLAASDVMNDTPTDNYYVLNPFDKNSSMTLAEGNLQLDAVSGGNNYEGMRATMGLPLTGKWYWECKTPNVGYITALGIADGSGSIIDTQNAPSEYTVLSLGGWQADYNSGTPHYCLNVSPTGGTNWTQATNSSAGSVFMMAVDMDEGSMWWGLDGTWFANSSGTTANPATNAGPQRTGLDDGTTWFPYAVEGSGGGGYSSSKLLFDFGQSGFAHTPPTGFLALSTGNLPTPTIAKPAPHFSATTYTGNSTTNAITTGQQPDLLWIKSRGVARYHNLFDSERTLAAGALYSNTYDVEDSVARIASLDTNGFTTSSTNYTYTNNNDEAYVAWSWKKSTTAGFGISTWTGEGAGDGDTIDVAHGCGGTPELVIAKDRDFGQDWIVWHHKLSTDSFLTLNENYSESTWDESYPLIQAGATNNTFGIDWSSSSYSLNEGLYGYGETTYVAYSMRSIEGYSLVGSYEGTNSADGPFVYCGFRPAFILMKSADNAESWSIWDDKRLGYNPYQAYLAANSSSLEDDTISAYNSNGGPDFLSNGFKMRGYAGSSNNSGTYIFYAVAEKPLIYANAR